MESNEEMNLEEQFTKIIVEASAGAYIGDFTTELYSLSSKYHCDVCGKFNDRDILVKCI